LQNKGENYVYINLLCTRCEKPFVEIRKDFLKAENKELSQSFRMIYAAKQFYKVKWAALLERPIKKICDPIKDVIKRQP
jgi:ubiquinone biosynthesis protein Coq4